MKITDAIRSEHKELEPLLLHVYEASASAANPQRAWIVAVAAALKKIVSRHARLETKLLFERLPQDDHWVIHVTNEHGEIEKNLDAAIGGSRKCLRHVANLLLGHFDEEEKWVLPLADRLIDPATLVILGAAWDEGHRRDPS